jgi:O-acetyl-ADP-ribose deacetylase (regulator of RNase III)
METPAPSPRALSLNAQLNRTAVKLLRGDLTLLPVDAIVYYAREDLALGFGFGTAIRVRGGDAVARELDKLGPIRVGEAVITTAGTMNASHIIPACGPKFHEPETEAKLRATMRAALRLADERGLRTIAFPPMGAGFCGVPLDLCAAVMLEEIGKHVAGETGLEEVTICVIDQREFRAFQEKWHLVEESLCTK